MTWDEYYRNQRLNLMADKISLMEDHELQKELLMAHTTMLDGHEEREYLRLLKQSADARGWKP